VRCPPARHTVRCPPARRVGQTCLHASPAAEGAG